MSQPIEAELLKALQRSGHSYLTIRQLYQRLPSPVFSLLGVKKSATTPSALLKLVRPHLGNRLIVLKGPRSFYISLNRPLEVFIFEKAAQKPGLSSRQLAQNLPMRLSEFVTHLNSLLTSGQIIGTLNPKHALLLRPAEDRQPKVETDTAESRNLQAQAFRRNAIHTETDASTAAREAFRQACRIVGRGRNFTRIHRIREHLGWPSATFDQVLEALRADYAIELHCGDPSVMTDAEIADSYTDKNGTLFITLTWWGESDE